VNVVQIAAVFWVDVFEVGHVVPFVRPAGLSYYRLTRPLLMSEVSAALNFWFSCLVASPVLTLRGNHRARVARSCLSIAYSSCQAKNQWRCRGKAFIFRRELDRSLT
jgi:hypothetical protein